MTARLDISLISALCLLLAVTFCSCSQIYDEEGPCEQEQKKGNGVSLKFKIYTEHAPTTRTRGLGEWEEKPANIAERILNPQDMRVLLFNASGYLVRTFKPNKLEDHFGEEEVGITGDGYYELSVYFEDENLDRMEDHEEIKFSVMILANINSLGGIYTTDGLVYGAARDNIKELFTMPANWFPSNTNGIPMYGYKSNFTATKAELSKGDFEVKDPITMLRALSKIEVYDNVEGTVIGGQKYPYVEKVELTSWRAKGYLRPLYDGYESGLKTAYIPGDAINPVITGESAPRVSAQEMTDGLGIEGKEENKKCFRVYCPEAKLADVKVLVTATLGPNDYKTYEVELGQYADGGPNNDNPDRIFGNDLVRNHIYRFSVNSLGASADLTVTVSNWGQKVQTHTLDDIISMDENGYLTWTNTEGNKNLSVTDENGKKQLSFLNGTADYAVGTFKINSPEDATWRAFFIPGENGVDAFEFVTAVDADGNVTSTRSYVEGTVGTEATIRVRGKGPADAYRHTAQLVVEVHQADGSVAYAPIAAAGETSYILYRENKL